MYASDAFPTGVIADAFQFGYEVTIARQAEDDPEPETWRHFQVICDDLNSQDVADNQVFTFDIVNFTDDKIDNTWTTADYDTIHTVLQNMLTTWAPHLASRMRPLEWRAYRRLFNPSTISKPWPDAGAPEAYRPLTVAFTGGSNIPPQPCSTITEMTPSRKNWGRLYTPTVAGNAIATNGRLSATALEAFAGGYHNLVSALWGAGFKVVVPTTSSGGKTVDGEFVPLVKRTLQAITNVRVDDVVDAHHRRRHKHKTDDHTLPAIAATLPAP